MYTSLEISNLEKLYSDNPDSIVFAFLAFRNLEQGNVQKAVSICEQGIKKHPEYAFGYFILGLCYYHLKDYAKAKTYLEISTTYDDKNPQAWKLLGEINEQLNHLLLAEECNLKYYLADSFNTDALERYQKEEIINFDVFNKGDETDVSAEEDAPKVEEEIADGAKLDNLFDKEIEEVKKDLNFTEADEEIFEEKIETSPSPSKDEVKDEVEQKADFESKEESLAESDDFFTEEKDVPTEPEETDDSDDFLDYRSVIKDIIEENEEDTFDSFESEPKIVMDESEGDDEQKISETPIEEQTVEEQISRPPILSPTIGEIYIAQGRFDEAMDVFKKLLKKEPDNQRYQKKLNDIQLIIDKQKMKSKTD